MRERLLILIVLAVLLAACGVPSLGNSQPKVARPSDKEIEGALNRYQNTYGVPGGGHPSWANPLYMSNIMGMGKCTLLPEHKDLGIDAYWSVELNWRLVRAENADDEITTHNEYWYFYRQNGVWYAWGVGNKCG